MQGRGTYQLDAAFDSTAGIVAVWWEKLAGGPSTGIRSQWRDYPATMIVTVCYLDGQWNVPVPRPPKTPYTRGIIFIDENGVVMQGPVGNAQTLPIVRPTG
jgi:hypothetical protein